VLLSAVGHRRSLSVGERIAPRKTLKREPPQHLVGGFATGWFEAGEGEASELEGEGAAGGDGVGGGDLRRCMRG